jgi:DNA modification methylase
MRRRHASLSPDSDCAGGRRCYAMEIDPRYAQVVIERWQAFTGREATRIDG